MKKAICAIEALWAIPALAEKPYPTPTRDGRERIQRTGTCPTGYVGKGDKCESLLQDTPARHADDQGAACRPATSQRRLLQGFPMTEIDHEKRNRLIKART